MKITLYGSAGTGTSTVGTLLAEHLGYEYLSSGAFARNEAREHGMTVYEYEEYSVGKPDIDRARDAKIREYGEAHDNFVFDSRLAWHFIPDSFKIQLTVDAEEAYARIAERENLDLDTARIKTEDRRRIMEDRFKALYPDIDFPPPHETFNVTFDTTHRKPEDVVADILKFLEGRV